MSAAIPSYSQNTTLKLRSIRHLCEDLLASALQHPLDCPSIAARPLHKFPLARHRFPK